MGLIEKVPPGPVAIDTAIVIYLVERHERFLPLIRPLFAAADEGKLQLVTSVITLLEVLVVPYRAGDSALAARYEAVLSRSRGLDLVLIDLTLIRAAAQIRATHGVRTPDSIQMAAGLARGCRSLLTNDRRLPSLPNLTVLQLGDYDARP
ncbi:MAG: PIN domain-containing protein [Gemmatimonas sp.]|nr:PIN domain-containing protein [Gemmatimonas sp.]